MNRSPQHEYEAAYVDWETVVLWAFCAFRLQRTITISCECMVALAFAYHEMTQDQSL